MTEMADIHAQDGAAFAKESKGGGSDAYRAFGAETHIIVLRHIGAIHGAAPPIK
jgi:putative membrane protein